MDNYFAVKWYEDQQKKRENSYQNGQISLLNRNLQNVLHQIQDKIDIDKYKLQEGHVNRKLVSCHVWNIGYANNFESKEIAVEQAIFISLILHLEEAIENRRYLQQEVDRYMRQLGNFDWALYGEFGRRKQMIQRIKTSDDIKRTI